MGRHPLVARWVLGGRSQNPSRRSLVPKWNLLVVLATLTEELFAFASGHAPGLDA